MCPDPFKVGEGVGWGTKFYGERKPMLAKVPPHDAAAIVPSYRGQVQSNLNLNSLKNIYFVKKKFFGPTHFSWALIFIILFVAQNIETLHQTPKVFLFGKFVCP